MNDKAKKIWSAWAEGRTVQRFMPWGEWEDDEPNECEVDDQPQSNSRWRIRRTKTVEYRFRIAIMDSGRDIPIIAIVDPDEYLEYEKQKKSFLKWATDEVQGEVERPL